MSRTEKTVFISYRRADRWPALAVFKDLTQHGHDVFIDYDGIASGDFERSIVDNIRARGHFVILLTPTALERCDDPADWLRREIVIALESQRNVVPLLLSGFTMQSPIASARLRGALEPLRRCQALNVPDDFFDAAMDRLRSKFLAVAVEAVIHPASMYAQQIADSQRAVASKAAAEAAVRVGEVVRLVPPAAGDPEKARIADPRPHASARTAGAPIRAKWKALAVSAFFTAASFAGIAWTVAQGSKKEFVARPTYTPTSAASSSVTVTGPGSVGVGTMFGGQINLGNPPPARAASATPR